MTGIKYFTAIALLVMAPWWSMNSALKRILRVSRSRVIEYSGREIRHFSPLSEKYRVTNLAAKKRANGEENPVIPSGWTTIKYGTEEDAKSAEMDDRIREAERWVSKKLSDKESQELNRAMGIEAEVLAALAAEEDENSGQKKKSSNKGKQQASDKFAAKNKLKEFLAAETQDAAKVKGFLELNPYVCSGCGTPFQSKSTDTPGFLPKDKIKVHLVKAQKIRDKQEAIKILEMAGIEVSVSKDSNFTCSDRRVTMSISYGYRSITSRFDALLNITP